MTAFGAVEFESGSHPVSDFNKEESAKKSSQDVGLSTHMLPPNENFRRNSDTSLSGMKSDEESAEESAKKRIKKKRKRLSFDEKVEVLPIPMRHEYSQTERARLWSSAIEIHENATRNTIEFASEGWDWKNVLEDDKMYVCQATSELIHPCHYGDLSKYGM
ncbi:unnamed protein product [Cylindrotheca closterium]|uniref:Uncharacterized protein n=1 Tax=Cylindrotheca closterium TaxID=2856 RepID=A0AAD2CNK2_9STRA|nr:unnamed protein product [Cylindrotheca closterium]